jgi:hypothetical protein
VQLDPIELRARERPVLVPDRVRDRGRPELVEQRGPPDRGDLGVAGTEQAGGAGGELRAAPTVTGPVRRLQVDEVGRHRERLVQVGALEDPVWFRFPVEHGVPRVHLGERVEPALSAGDEEVGELRVVGPVATVACGVEGFGW